MYDEPARKSLNKFVAKCFEIATTRPLAGVDAVSSRSRLPFIRAAADLDFAPMFVSNRPVIAPP
jgi:hypothetical protein